MYTCIASCDNDYFPIDANGFGKLTALNVLSEKIKFNTTLKAHKVYRRKIFDEFEDIRKMDPDVVEL